ncbi:Crp/Fnr family transcriptional regulator [Paenibacillus sp. FA6]|uniref:Crp/Fnr family transcriptional regulator n=1 Tax=Paenibacillus sp. FA6 TaxID=3413029 RepID=UPI003F65BC1A
MEEMLVFLREFPFFKQLEVEELQKVSSYVITRTYDKGVNVFLEDGDGDELYIIQSGVVKIYRENEAREIILAIFTEGDFFGEMAVLENELMRSASAKTMEETTLYVLKRHDFHWLMNNNPQISLKIMQTALQRLRKANELITDLTILDARTRVTRGLLRLIEDHGVRHEDGIWIDLKLTHQQIADMTGTVRETVTKIMLELQNQNTIKIDKKKIFIYDIAKFEQLTGGI